MRAIDQLLVRAFREHDVDPRHLISHGLEDAVLPIANTRRLVEQLRNSHDEVRYDKLRGPTRWRMRRSAGSAECSGALQRAGTGSSR